MERIEHTYKRTGIDILRGISIIGIVLFHLFPSAFPGGFIGVLFFFVLSGYLMSEQILSRLRNNDFSIISYYKKRICRIYPPLFMMIVVTCSFLTFTDISRLNGILPEIISIFTGCNNWWQIVNDMPYFSQLEGGSLFTHLWFLSVELQFYIIAPLILMLYYNVCTGSNMCTGEADGKAVHCAKQHSAKHLHFVFLLLAASSALWMFWLYVPGEEPVRVYYGTDTMAFSLFIGMFLRIAAYRYAFLRRALREKYFYCIAAGFVIITVLLFLIVQGQSDYLYRGGMFAISLVFAYVLNVFENSEETIKKLPFVSALAYIGRKSYIIYLWHYPVIMLAINYFKG